MALSHTVITRSHLGTLKAVVVETTFDSTYPAGGEPLAAADVGLSQVVAVFAAGAAAADAGTAANEPKWDRANGKLQLFETGAALSGDFAEQNTADQSAKKVVLLVLGH